MEPNRQSSAEAKK